MKKKIIILLSIFILMCSILLIWNANKSKFSIEMTGVIFDFQPFISNSINSKDWNLLDEDYINISTNSKDYYDVLVIYKISNLMLFADIWDVGAANVGIWNSSEMKLIGFKVSEPEHSMKIPTGEDGELYIHFLIEGDVNMKKLPILGKSITFDVIAKTTWSKNNSIVLGNTYNPLRKMNYWN